METHKTRMVQKQIEEKYDIKTTCNCCGKNVKSAYYEITTSTRFWGNDSVDSIERFDICKNCFVKFMELINNKKLGDEKEGIKTNNGFFTEEYDCIDIKYTG